jgi:2'-5' RNA ligase
MATKAKNAKKAAKPARATEPEVIRAFVALDLEPMSLRRVVRLSDRLRMASGAPSAVWVPGPKMHVTVKFVAELPTAVVPALSRDLAALVAATAAPAPCSLRLDAFPSAKDAHTVVVELLDDRGELAKLAAKVEKLTSKHDVPVEKRAYRPHVTLARLKLAYDSRKWLRPEIAEIAGECRAAAMTLYRSVLGAEGATYEVLGRFAWAAGD